MTTTATKNFLGIPVSGEIQNGRLAKKQRTLEEFGPILQAALDVPGLHSLRWRQYTPYFNDGEPCEFSIYDIGIRLDTTPEEAGDYEDGYVYVSDTSIAGGEEEIWDGTAAYEYTDWRGTTSTRHGKHVKTGRTFPRHEGYEALKAIARAIPSGEFYNVLLGAFGDHATVTVTREGIEVETYEHD